MIFICFFLQVFTWFTLHTEDADNIFNVIFFLFYDQNLAGDLTNLMEYLYIFYTYTKIDVYSKQKVLTN